ncbi:MAG TPA: efflux RND transporter periplasmic adaptor subunit [Casimicrobiaceae bacterium]|nr:efflux RND transporter periplasmic adaptor subunit [Casimicrobiaceae bacterium]
MAKGTAKRMIIMLVIAAVIVGGVVGFQQFKNTMIAKAIKGGANPPQTVSTTVARESTWQPTVQALGNLLASQEASLGAEVGGLVTAIHFDSGEKVRAGQPLVELNPAPLKAQLAQLEAQSALAELTLKRDEAQLKVRAISQAAVDNDAATLKSAQAQVAAQKALIAQKTIAAPFSGQLGIRQVNLGQYLAPGSAIVTLQKLDPMDVDFTVPQNQIDLIRIGMKAELQTSAAPGKTFAATVTAIEPQVDTTTRNLKVRARVPNPKGDLLPGVFATVHITQGEARQYVTLPNAAVAYNPYGATVFIVKDEGKGPDGKPKLVAEQRFITPGPTRGDQVAIVEGVKAGETVVTAGQLKLRNGSPIVVNNTVQPSDNPNPQVPNS